ncbi:MAG: hypothetical protein COX44_01895 [Candidatus Portnoybacteria bacterium CG23_combo_of_CG06-09_8_20_14_all_37_13]|uniref:Uncharacterized protein n=1 Tax=Candidatus Portnoybacteria bacterium CG23_combo_of_CG06-09_8_20_14_all_37_13 TaxID=1974819 RepID=A0A2G9YEW7_9BACT|nr:MAG: hypothetical protein COX44_01895 [Candidatus Portnoybacteria bacterium CG23_combo_of_CG06-09_8_20_14_all_37_13]
MSPAHGCGGARATIKFNNGPSAKKGEVQTGGQKGRGLGGSHARGRSAFGGEFLPACRSEAPPPCSFRAKSSKKVFFSF